MRIIAKKALRAFGQLHPNAEEPLLAWYREVEKEDWDTPAKVKAKYRTASAIGAIEFRLEQAGLSQRDLVPFIGSRAKVSEVLSGKRRITMPMARALHEHLGISAEVLLQEPGASLADPLAGIEWNRFPIKA